MRLVSQRGQSTGEYAILIAVAVGAIVAMQLYVKRGLQGRVKGASDFMASQTPTLGTLQQYEPYYNASNYNVKQDRKAEEGVVTGGATSRTAIDEITTRTGNATTETDQSKDDDWK